MAEGKQKRVIPVEVDVDDPAVVELLKAVVEDTSEFEAVALIDIKREQCRVKPKPDEYSDNPVRLAKDVLDRGTGKVRKDLLSLGDVTFAALEVDGHWLLLLPLAPGKVVVACIDCHGKLETLSKHAKRLSERLAGRDMIEVLQAYSNVQRGWLLDLDQGAVTGEFKRKGSEQRVALKVIDELHPLEQILPAARAFLDVKAVQPRLDWLHGVMLELGGRTQLWQRLEYVPQCIVWAQSDGHAWNEKSTAALRRFHDDILRQLIAQTLSSGLETVMEPFPQTDLEFNEIVEELRNLQSSDLVQRLVLGGFADHPIGEGQDRKRCMECIYFLPNRRWCDLPELPVPVEADWFCRLWKL